MKKAIVMGATSGIGLEVARLLARQGYAVGVAGRRADRLAEAVNAEANIVVYRPIDVNDTEAVKHLHELIDELGGIRTAINNIRKKKNEAELSMDDMLVKLFNEVEYVWPRVGYPPLVTPFSQYVKNISLMNLLTMEQGKGRFVMMDDSM